MTFAIRPASHRERRASPSAAALLAASLAACAAGAPVRPEPAPPPAALEQEATPQEEHDPYLEAEGDPEDTWIRLVSGEWLRGRIGLLREESFEFESAELGTLEIDWDSVAELRSRRVQTLLLADRRTVVGALSVDGERVVVEGDERVELTRDELLAIVPGEPSEWNYWSGDLSIGATTRSGNTEQTDLTFHVRARRETAATRWLTVYDGSYAEVEAVETANNHRLDSRYDWFLNDRLYVTPIGLQVFRDPFQNIALRVTPGTGLGYDLVDESDMRLTLVGGPAYQYTRLQSAPAGSDEIQRSFAAIGSLGWRWDVTGTFEFGLDYALTVPLPDSQAYNSRLTALVDVDLIWDFSLQVRFVWDRVNDPRPGDSGEVPEKDDFRTTVGLSLEF